MYATESILLVDADVVRQCCCKLGSLGSQFAERLVSDCNRTLCKGGRAGDEENISMVEKTMGCSYEEGVALGVSCSLSKSTFSSRAYMCSEVEKTVMVMEGMVMVMIDLPKSGTEPRRMI